MCNIHIYCYNEVEGRELVSVSEKKVKPILIDFYRDTKTGKGIDFVSYAFALEEHINHLEKKLEGQKREDKKE